MCFSLWIVLFFLAAIIPLQKLLEKINLSVYPMPFTLIENNIWLKSWITTIEKKVGVY